MKFKKAVLINIAETHFEEKYWNQIDDLVESRVSLSRDDPKLIDELKDCDCLMIGFQVPVDKDLLEAAPNLKLINILATAYGTVDLEAATARNIPVCNLASYGTEGVAELSIALLLFRIFNLQEAIGKVEIGDYSFAGVNSREIKNSNFGVVGLGHIGNRVAELAAGLDAKVSYWSRQQKDVPFAYKDLDTLLSESDFISLNVAETEETKNLINAERITQLKPGTVLIQSVPPEIVDMDALLARLEKGDITYVTDHVDELTEAQVSKMKTLPNVTMVAPLGITTDGVRKAKQETFISNLEAALNGSPINKVN